MFALSQTAGYAITALSQLVTRPNEWTLARDLAAETEIPLPYLSKILQLLTRSQLVRAKRGYRGGFVLARPANQMRLLDIVEAIDGTACLSRCMLGLSSCSEDRACPAHLFWKNIRLQIAQELSQLTLADVARFEASRAQLRELIDSGSNGLTAMQAT